MVGTLDPERENMHGKKWGFLFLFLLKLIDWLRFQRKRIWCGLCETWDEGKELRKQSQ